MAQRQDLYDPSYEHDACGVGFIANIDGKKSHDIVEQSIRILVNLEHRGAVGGDMKTGDGAGLLMQIPDVFFRRVLPFELPPAGSYGVGFFFLPRDEEKAATAREIVEESAASEGARLLGRREVPVQEEALGETALEVMPRMEQAFFAFDSGTPEPGKNGGTARGSNGHGGGPNGEELERRFYLLRKVMEKRAAELGLGIDDFYIPSLSSRTIVYKGMFVSTQFTDFYPDVTAQDFTSAIALVHQRYSTNTFPSWQLAQPFRFIAHNGEINTLRRNTNNMAAREKSLSSPVFGEDVEKLKPVVNPIGSDSAIFDNVYELLVRGGRSLEHSMMMMVPEAFGTRYHISEDKRHFYEYHAAIMEPWDGPAALVFSDGLRIGATLDRNGLRPGRYLISRSGKVLLASEAGVLDFSPEDVLEKGRLAPGRMFMVDTVKQRVIKDNELKASVSRGKPYRRWLEKNRLELKGLFGLPSPAALDKETLSTRQRAFGYSLEDMLYIITPMVTGSQEPIGSMGNDAAPAVLSDRPQLLYDYFKQIFAQVTNPPIDPYRESLVMSLMSFVGRERNLLDESPEHCRQLKLAHPILTNDDIGHLRNSYIPDYEVRSVSILFERPVEGRDSDPPAEIQDSPCALAAALEKVCREAERQIDDGASLIILSDRNIDKNHIAIPALLAVSGVHQYLVERGKRHLSGLVIETGEAREVQHFATLVSFGASGINPYLVFESIVDLKNRGYLPEEMSLEQASENYITAVKKGLLKVMSKMGISTIRSYRGSQIYEAVGLNSAFISRYFSGTSSRIEGVGIETVEADTVARHESGFRFDEKRLDHLDSGGLYRYRQNSTKHRFTPQAIVKLQKAVRQGSYELFKEYSEEINDNEEKLFSLRGLFSFREGDPVPIEEVEPEEEIVKRFTTGAMSFGSLSREAHTTIARAMNRLGGMSNSGEGGEDPRRYEAQENGDLLSSKVKQIASARFGVTGEYVVNAKELQIKMAQGAKPGEGGQLPGHKVNDEIARVRYSTPGVMLISPPPHHDIYSIEDLAQLIYDLKHANTEARVSVKLVSEIGVGTIAAGVAKGKADMVLISSGEGGTGASPLSSIRHAGSYWELGLSETQQVLVRNKLREKIRVQVDGQLRTGRDVVIGALLGAEEFGFGTVTLVSLGCVMMRKCHLNSCPVGVATQDPELRKRFKGEPEHLMNFMRFVAREVRELMAQLGFRSFDEMVGRVDMLDRSAAVRHFKAKGLDYSRILARPEGFGGVPLHSGAQRSGGGPAQGTWQMNGGGEVCGTGQSNGGASAQGTWQVRRDFSDHPDAKLIEGARALLDGAGGSASGSTVRSAATVYQTTDSAVEVTAAPVRLSLEIRNHHRTVGATLSAEVTRRFGAKGLPEDSITVDVKGSAGQSFGAFLAPGITLGLEGEANDYFGKGLSGGKLIVYPPAGSSFIPHKNIITGNVNLFGATGGEAYIYGMAGERFAVRNSGAIAVVESVGDHGCEYMTGGAVIVLGRTGVNFAAGMSGGVAYVLDENQLFDTRCNLEMVDVEQVIAEEDEQFLTRYIRRHAEYTGSRRAAELLEEWREYLPYFVKVIPIDYKRALERIRREQVSESEHVELTEEVGG